MTDITRKKTLAASFAIIGLTALVTQYFISLFSAPISEFAHVTVRYFSFFTILTNWMVAIYFAYQALKKTSYSTWLDRPGILTALGGYIVVVGLVYNTILRQLLNAQGLALILEEIFHTLIPLCTIFFWYYYGNAQKIAYTRIALWLIYPLTYAGYTILHGHFSGFYPYPFVDVTALGIKSVLINMCILLVIFVGLFSAMLRISRRIHTK